ncbi:MAG: DUF2935 domain-containing protein [Acutalibacteraceae bacterium]
MYTDNYVIKSLELHLFFARIMKEHALFLKAGFTPAQACFSEKSEFFKCEFEQLLCKAAEISQGIISCEVIDSGELVTEFTFSAEKQTERFTCIDINGAITKKELELSGASHGTGNPSCLMRPVHALNRKALELLSGLIEFKESILQNVLSCKAFTVNYPLLIEHIIREAKLYRRYVSILEKDGDLNYRAMKDTESFWNRIMMEHAMFIRGLLDPSEAELFSSADDFANQYAALLESSRNAQNQTIKADSLEETIKFKEFKQAGAQGIIQCRIRSIILPLLADHVLREANHYIRLLKC